MRRQARRSIPGIYRTLLKLIGLLRINHGAHTIIVVRRVFDSVSGEPACPQTPVWGHARHSKCAGMSSGPSRLLGYGIFKRLRVLAPQFNIESGCLSAMRERNSCVHFHNRSDETGSFTSMQE